MIQPKEGDLGRGLRVVVKKDGRVGELAGWAGPRIFVSFDIRKRPDIFTRHELEWENYSEPPTSP